MINEIILSPSWAVELEGKEPSDFTAEYRHRWMCNALKERRKLQMINQIGVSADENNDISKYYLYLILPFFKANQPPRFNMLEILSDGMGSHEPFWHGIKINVDGNTSGGLFMPLGEKAYTEYRKKVHHYRKKISQHYMTHLQIGENLIEPTLFKVTKDNVMYHRYNRWYDIDCLKLPLPIKCKACKGDDNLESRNMQNSSGDCLNYKDTLLRIKDNLIVLSRKVLWPALLDDDIESKEPISLVFIYASTWQVPGVWALHILPDRGTVSKTIRQSDSHIHSIIDPPSFCINDALGSLYKRDSTHRSRYKDVELFRRCKGIKQTKGALWDEYRVADKNEVFIYELNYKLRSDPIKRFSEIYKLACNYYYELENGKYVPQIGPNDKHLSQILKALESCFIGWSYLEDSPYISRLLINEAEEICRSILCDMSLISLPDNLVSLIQNILSESNNKAISFIQLDDSQITYKSTSYLFAICLASIAIAMDKTAENITYLSLCGHAFRVLILCPACPTDLPTRDGFAEWKRANKCNVLDVFCAYPCNEVLHEEAKWFMNQLLENSGT